MKTLIFDTETTGIPRVEQPFGSPDQPRMASIAWALVDLIPHPKDPTVPGIEVLEHVTMKLVPDWPEEVRKASAAAFEINGHTLEELEQEGVQLSDAITILLSSWIKADQVASYGADFDMFIIRNEIMHVNHKLFGAITQQLAKPQVCIRTMVIPICAMPPTERMMAAGRKHYKTPTLVEAVKIMLDRDVTGAHDPLVDLSWTVKLWGNLARRGLVT